MAPNETPKSKKKLAGNLLFYGLLLLLIFSIDARSWVLQQLVKVGLFNAEIKKETFVNATEVAPSFFLYKADGTTLSTANLKGKVVFINFWATWCPPCRAEMPSLQALYNKLGTDDRFVFLFINEDDDAAKATAFLKQKEYTFPLTLRAGKVPEAIFAGTLPTTVVLDKEGRIAFKEEGIANYNTSRFMQQLKSLL